MSGLAIEATFQIDNKKINPMEKLLLLALAKRAGENHECWPSIKRIMEDTGLSERTIQRLKKTLIEKGFIAYTGNYMGRTQQIPVLHLPYVNDFKYPEKLSTTPVCVTGVHCATPVTVTPVPPSHRRGYPRHSDTLNNTIENKIEEREALSVDNIEMWEELNIMCRKKGVDPNEVLSKFKANHSNVQYPEMMWKIRLKRWVENENPKRQKHTAQPRSTVPWFKNYD